MGYKFKPCPFCGSIDVTIGANSYSVRVSERLYVVECGQCFARTGQYMTEEKAVEKWNIRSEQSLAADLTSAGKNHS